ncbi:methyltransferase family protein [Thermobispora bispora]|uniref:Isoprenylcysteine carboxyl methyltransferase n=1 Tax=Thermobispora bispora (strain ATCC 19993 / DSM 43833 / CBS 139.67 / JCM 10125 / KCTC 9307 / NBRC 14880 / R51) TaxID=469371 RepID=D6Y4C0_THEBD|nr:isoprenylcysteine carboxylmethyltransferase family protein [Thermobispora bispora]ADG87174.1 conserved hypothetical protein [Thermobispora bispora DSM 43833]MDI9581414.1 isoprenylcysteine carboxylmethyltransferase family protein [Thermobispora sp.]QSI47135.1 isoprenylcysteine carboxylmethyltransferase family protein [Thermobispora bispora]
MALTALAVYLVSLALAFGVRTWVQWRRTGDTGFRGGGLRPGSVQWWARLLFIAALVAVAAGPVAELAGLAAVPALDVPVVRVSGLILALLGTAAVLAAQASMGASWRIGVDESERTDLVTTGAFAMVRNPIFTAMMITAAGLAAMVPNVVSLAALALTVVSIEVQVRAVEEPYLLRVHGEAYARYAARVGRFLPGLGRLRRSGAPAGR